MNDAGAGTQRDADGSERKFRTLFTSLTDAALILDAEHFLDGNPAALKLFGCRSVEELCTKHPSDISPDVQAGGEESRELANRYISEALHSGSKTFPWIHTRLDGTAFFAEVTLTPINFGAAPMLLAVVRDVSATKLSHDKLMDQRKLLRTVIDNIPDTVYVKDASCRKVIANRADVQRSGNHEEAEVIGKTDFDMYPTEIAALFFADDQHVLQTGDPVLNREEFVYDESGNKQWLLTSKIALHDENGTVVGLVGIGRDITERKQSEAALLESEQRYRRVIEQTSDGIYILDVESRRIIEANTAFAHLLGYSEQEILGLTVYDIVAASRESIDARIGRIAGQKAALAGERLYRKKSGDIFPVWVSYTVVPFRNRSAVCTMVHDISQQKKKEEELRASEERFRLISENVEDCTLMFSSTGECLYASLSLNRLGYDAEDMRGGNIFDKIHPDDLPLVREEIEAVQWSLAHRSIEFHFRRMDASWVMMEATISLLINDEGSKILMVMRDITERKRNELHLREMMESLQRKNEEIERTVQKLTQMQSTLVQSEKLASIGQLTAGIAHEINNPLAFLTSNLNRFAEYYEETRALLQLWEDLGASIGDGTPFSAAVAAIVRKEKERDLDFIEHDFKELMTHTREGSARIKHIVDQLRGFSHMATDDFSHANINQALDETLTLVWNEIKYTATVKKAYGDIPPVPCNIGEMKQVFVNLLVNAGHAIAEKGEITLHTERAGAAVLVQISDTGSGIPKENLKRIFDPFFTTKAVGKGTGLGLWIVSTIMDKHHGSIAVDSEVGKGTCFTLTMPIEQSSAAGTPL